MKEKIRVYMSKMQNIVHTTSLPSVLIGRDVHSRA